jgi:uncharacterized protein (TIGR03790 family)
VIRGLRARAIGSACGCFAAALLLATTAQAQSAENVAVVINDASPESTQIGEYYVRQRAIPESNVIHITTSTDDTILPNVFVATIQQPIAAAISRANLHDRILYIVLTKGIPLRVAGTAGQDGTVSSVDSELTLLYRRMSGQVVQTRGRVDNPYYLGARPVAEAAPFTRRNHDIYLVSRIDAFTVDEARALIDRSLRAGREGQVVLDQRDAPVNRLGEDWLGLAAQQLTKAGHADRVFLEATPKPAREVSPVIGYYSWGSTDPQNRVRVLKMDFTPGALAATFVSTDARTFKEPPAAWTPTNTNDRSTWFGGSPQSLVGDLIREGVTGVAGQVAEPYLQSAVRPDILFPAYLAGLNLIEAFYLAIPHLSWQTVVVGDPLCAPFPGTRASRADIDGGIDATQDLPTFFAGRRLAQVQRTMPGVAPGAAGLALRAETLLSRGDREAARKTLEEASALAPDQVRLHILIAELMVAAGESAPAAVRYQRVLELEPRNVVALNNLAYDLAVREKKPAEALELARRALALAPNDATIMDTVGWIEFQVGNTAAANKLLVQAAKGAPRNAEIRLHNAVVLAAQGARGAAESELAEALKLDPNVATKPEAVDLKARLGDRQK